MLLLLLLSSIQYSVLLLSISLTRVNAASSMVAEDALPNQNPTAWPASTIQLNMDGLGAADGSDPGSLRTGRLLQDAGIRVGIPFSLRHARGQFLVASSVGSGLGLCANSVPSYGDVTESDCSDAHALWTIDYPGELNGAVRVTSRADGRVLTDTGGDYLSIGAVVMNSTDNFGCTCPPSHPYCFGIHEADGHQKAINDRLPWRTCYEVGQS